jgi:hypothetical protein
VLALARLALLLAPEGCKINAMEGRPIQVFDVWESEASFQASGNTPLPIWQTGADAVWALQLAVPRLSTT